MEAIPENDSQGSASAMACSQPAGTPSAGTAPEGAASQAPGDAPGHAQAPSSAAAGSDPNERLTEILTRISGADPSQIKPEARLIEDIGIDSLGFYEILIEADECLGIKIREEDLLKFRTVGDIQNHLRQLYPTDAQAH
jgi:acyl carrier protein